VSHFSVMVIGTSELEDISEILYPYQESSDNPASDSRFIFEDHTDSVFKKYNNMDTSLRASWSDVRNKNNLEHNLINFGKWYGGYSVVNGRLGVYSNPNSQWDWWEVGGRWTDFFKHKDGSFADSITLEEWDFKGQMREAEISAGRDWDIAQGLISKAPPFKTWKHFVDLIDSKAISLDEAQSLYNAQDIFSVWRSNENPTLNYCSVDAFCVSRDSYVSEKALRSTLPFAYILDKHWVERGSMGWFALVSGEIDIHSWATTFFKMLETLDPRTKLTIVDCHI